MTKLIRDIIQGETDDNPRRESILDVAIKEEGMISLVTIQAVLFLLILIGLVGNTGRIVSEKIEVQNGADAVAYSSGIVMARALNAVTASNHLIGELNALAVLQHALNGEGEDRPPSGRMNAVDKMLSISFRMADAVKHQTFPSHPNERISFRGGAYDLNNEIPSDAGATIAWSMHRLQLLLAWTYEAYTIGALLQKSKWPIAVAIGAGIASAAIAVEFKIGQERLVLDQLKTFSDRTDPIKRGILENVIPIVYAYQIRIRDSVPNAVRNALNEVREGNRLDDAQIFPSFENGMLDPPLKEEPENFGTEGESDNELYRSQLVRASYPWVKHWRHPILTLTEFILLLARTGLYYEHYSDRYTRELSYQLKEKQKVHLLVLKDTNLESRPKGEEPWNQDSLLADQRFAIVGFSHRTVRNTISPQIFPPEIPNGLVCYSQALVYNANPQKPGSGNREWQTTVGWDTLNWKVQVPEMPATQKNANEFQIWRPSKNKKRPPRPEIRLNWQVKLVPVNRMQDAKWTLKGSIRKEMDRVNSQFRDLLNH